MSHPFAYDRPDIVFETIVDVLLQMNPGVSRAMLLSHKREEGGTAQIRQIAMYLASGVHQIEFKTTAAFFERDRTTVRHAVQTVDEWSANPMFDDVLLTYRAHLGTQLDAIAQKESEGFDV